MDRHGETVSKGGADAQPPVLTKVQLVTLTLRVVMEAAIVVGLAYWGYQVGSTTASRIAMAVGAPLLLFGFWGLVDFHQAGRAAEPLRLAQELGISGAAAWALWLSGFPLFGVLLALLSVGYHVLVYASGSRLLKPPASLSIQGAPRGSSLAATDDPNRYSKQ